MCILLPIKAILQKKLQTLAIFKMKLTHLTTFDTTSNNSKKKSDYLKLY